MPRCHSYVGQTVSDTTSNYSRGSGQCVGTEDELAQQPDSKSTQPIACEASSSRSINQLVAEPSGDDVQAGLHQAVRASIAPPFRTAIMIGEGGFQFQLCGGEFHRERRIKRPRLGSLFELVEHPLRLLHIEHGYGRVAEGTDRV